MPHERKPDDDDDDGVSADTIGPNSKLSLYQQCLDGPGLRAAFEVFSTEPSRENQREDVVIDVVAKPLDFVQSLEARIRGYIQIAYGPLKYACSRSCTQTTRIMPRATGCARSVVTTLISTQDSEESKFALPNLFSSVLL